MNFIKNIKAYGKYDVVVVGAGPGGAAAAVAAARLGKAVLLLERTSSAGGVATNSACSYLMGYSHEGNQIIGGIAEEFIRRAGKMGYAVSEDGSELEDDKPFNNVSSTPHGIRRTWASFFKEYNVQCLFYASMIAAETDGRRISRLLVDMYDGIYSVEADSFVDATGDANLVCRAGGEVINHPPEDCMTKTLFFTVGGVKAFDKQEIRTRYLELYENGDAPIQYQDRFMCYRLPNNQLVGVNMTMTQADGLSSVSLTEADFLLREQIDCSFRWIKENFEEFKNSYIIDTSFYVGVRCGRNMRGNETLTQRSVEQNHKCEQPVALGMRSYGGHALTGFRPTWASSNGGTLSIPWRTLISKSFINVFAAGRCISAEAKVLDTFRFMPRCMAIGEAAGITAALSCGNVESVSYEDVRSVLLKNRAILNNKKD